MTRRYVAFTIACTFSDPDEKYKIPVSDSINRNEWTEGQFLEGTVERVVKGQGLYIENRFIPFHRIEEIAFITEMIDEKEDKSGSLSDNQVIESDPRIDRRTLKG